MKRLTINEIKNVKGIRLDVQKQYDMIVNGFRKVGMSQVDIDRVIKIEEVAE